MEGAVKVSSTSTEMFHCAYKSKDAGMKSKDIEIARGEGGGRHHYRHVENDVPLCMRQKVGENEAKSKEMKRAAAADTCDGGSIKKAKKLKVNAKAQEAAGAKQNMTTSESKSEKDIPSSLYKRT